MGYEWGTENLQRDIRNKHFCIQFNNETIFFVYKNSFVSVSRLICTVKHSSGNFHCYNFSNILKSIEKHVLYIDFQIDIINYHILNQGNSRSIR